MQEYLKQNTTVNGWDFEYVENDYDDIFFQCRGDVLYDDDHDEMPEPSLWRAALELEKQLELKGIRCEANHSEKGWVEVTIFNQQ